MRNRYSDTIACRWLNDLKIDPRVFRISHDNGFPNIVKRIINHKFNILLISFLLFNSASADSENLKLVWKLGGFSNPESVVYNPQLGHLYVSNINGGLIDKDRNGYISILSTDGRIINEKWITGLNAPKGLALYGRTLYAADIDELVAINIDNGRISKYKVNNAKFLNDVTAADNGDIYVSDMLTNRIHVLRDNDFSLWLESDELESPNGLLFWGDDIILGSWGKITDGLATEVSGHLKRISIQDKTITSFGDGSSIGNLDGVEADMDGNFYVTDWMNGKLFHIEQTGAVTEILDLEQGSADLEFIVKKDLILIPMMKDNKLLAYKVHPEGKTEE